MVTGDTSNDKVLLTCVPADALGDEQVDEGVLPGERAIKSQDFKIYSA